MEIFEKLVIGISLQDKMAKYTATKTVSDLQSQWFKIVHKRTGVKSDSPIIKYPKDADALA
jgi:hypothetical protein